MEKNFRSQESLVSHVDGKRLFRDTVHAVKFAKLGGIAVIFGKLFCDVGAYVAVFFFDGFRSFQGLLRRYADLAFAQQALDEVGDVTTGDGNVLNAASNYKAFCL